MEYRDRVGRVAVPAKFGLGHWKNRIDPAWMEKRLKDNGAAAYEPVENLEICSLFKNDEMQGERISRNKVYLRRVEEK
ncbi:MAG: hypothetical protein ACLFOY_00555 [Desulfatibacillaceae bacterium]